MFDDPIGYNPAFLKRVAEKRGEPDPQPVKTRDDARKLRAMVATKIREAGLKSLSDRVTARFQRDELVRAAIWEAERHIETSRAAAIRTAENIRKEAFDQGEKILRAARLVATKQTGKEIASRVAKKYGCTLADLQRRCNAVDVVAVRDEAIATVYVERPDMSITAIARVFRRHQASIRHALQKGIK